MSFERRPGQTLWLQVADALNAEISAGLHSAGAQLPTEPELMRRFGVSRFTVRQAMAHLQSTGVVRVEQGRGTFVAAPAMVYDISHRTRFSRNLIEQGIEPGTEHLSHEVIPATEVVAEALGLAVGTQVIRRRSISTADGSPLSMADAYFPVERFPDFERVRAEHATVTETLRVYGIDDFYRAWTTIGARAAFAEEAALLNLSLGAPVLVTSKLDVDTEQRPIGFAITIWSAELVTFRLADDQTE
ncbi:phosphonate metabolism transcriptional regulator PhnF [soil metagenome]